jgi:hypothetical protein
MISPYLVRLWAVVALSLCLAGCGKSESYRYKLTLTVNTPAGVKRGSSVAEVAFWDVSIPERGTAHQLRGEALYLDLGHGARPLVALLKSHLNPKDDKGLYWTRDAGPGTRQMSRLYDIPPSIDFTDDVPRIAKMRGAHRIAPGNLPDLVTFADINDPKTVIEVDPNDLQATLGQGVTWNEITLESTDEPITSGIRTKLPWIEAYFQKNLRLDGQNLEFPKKDIANNLSWDDFDLSGDLKRK